AIRPSRGVERQYLQFHRQINFAYLNVVRHLQHERREVQDAVHPALDQTVTDCLCRVRRRGDHPDRDSPYAALPGNVVEMRDGHTTHGDADQVRVDIEQCLDRESPAGEAAVVCQRMSQITDSHHSTPVCTVEPENAFDLAQQDSDVVPDATRAVGTDVGQVLA